MELNLIQALQTHTMQLIQQNNPIEHNYSNTLKPVSYEHNLSTLDRITQQMASAGDNALIVISRLGKGENPIYNNRRLYTVKTYLKAKIHSPETRLIIATGEPTENYGLLEFYIKGKKYEVVALKKNQEFWITEIQDLNTKHDPTDYYLPKPTKKNKTLKQPQSNSKSK